MTDHEGNYFDGDLGQQHIDLLGRLTDEHSEIATSPSIDIVIELADNYGIGDRQDHLSDAEYQVIEAGEPWKVEAEMAITEKAKTIIFSGRTNRHLSETEIDYVHKRYDATNIVFEYDMVRLMANNTPGFVPLEEDEVIPFSYQVTSGNKFMDKPSGQLKKIGQIGNQDVFILRLDSETFMGEDKKSASRFTPDNAAILGFMSQVLSYCLDDFSRIALVTTTDIPSNWTHLDRAALNNDRRFDLAAVGRDRLETTGAEFIGQLTIKDILREFANVRNQLLKLRQETALSTVG